MAATLTFDTGETLVQISHHRDNDKSPMHIGPPKLASSCCNARFGLGVYLKQDFNIGYRIRHAGMDISKCPIGLSQLYTVWLIDLSRKQLSPAEAAFARTAQGRNRHARPLQRYHERLRGKRADRLSPFYRNLENITGLYVFRPAGVRYYILRRAHDLDLCLSRRYR